jgi:hypothetical protein
MQRIYQGRITAVYEQSPSGDWRPVETGQAVHSTGGRLWRGHQLFQDAVNYYLTAFAALGHEAPNHPGCPPDERFPARQFRVQAEQVWQDYRRVPERRPGLAASVNPHLGLPPDATFAQAAQVILGGLANPGLAFRLALDALAEDAQGAAQVQQQGRAYFPLFCNPASQANPPRGHAALVKKEGEGWIPGALWRANTRAEQEAVVARLTFEHFAKPNSSGKRLDAAETKKRLIQAVEFHRASVSPETAAAWKATIDQLPDSTQIPAYGAVNKDALKQRFYAYLLVRFTGLDDTTFALLRAGYRDPGSKLPKPNPQVSPTEQRLRQLGDDPVRVARGERGFVFRAFTALPTWGAADPADIRWTELDIAAFKEALKVLNLFAQKTAERLDRLEACEAWLKAFAASNPTAGMASDADEEEPDQGPVGKLPARRCLGADSRWAGGAADSPWQTFFNQLQTAEGERRLSRRALRGSEDIFAVWEELLGSSTGTPEAEIAERLKSAVHRRQARQRYEFGDPNLFLALADPAHWCFWSTAHRRRGDVSDFLGAVCDHAYVTRLKEELQEPVALQPAHPLHSRRLLMLSDLGGRSAAKPVPGQPEAIEVSLPQHVDGAWTDRRVRLTFTAPRAERDGLLGDGEWLQALARGLGLRNPTQTPLVKHSAVALMPDPLARAKLQAGGREPPLRMLLNFPADLPTEWISHAPVLDKARRWAAQFNQKDGQNMGLYWPEVERSAGQKKTPPWWENPAILEEGFRVLGIDLGQRTAAAFAVLRVDAKGDFGRVGSSGTPRQPFLSLGTAGGKTWACGLLAKGLLRLPGEDAQQMAGDNLVRERGGRQGRLADLDETAEMRRILHLLTPLLRPRAAEDDPEEETPEARYRHLPEQNDFLLRILRAATWRVRKLFNAAWALETPRAVKVCEDLAAMEFAADAGFPRPQAASPAGAVTADQTQVKRIADWLAKTAPGWRERLVEAAMAIANRVVPLRGHTWDWLPLPAAPEQPGNAYSRLMLRRTPGVVRRITGQRGLSLARISQIEALRQRLQSLNKLCAMELFTCPKFGAATRDDSIPDPCPLLLDKLDRAKTQRVNLTAHLILRQALGLRPTVKPPGQDGKHGQYEPIPSARPVDMVVLERLGAYRTREDQGPRENARLMQWCQRQVVAKIKMLLDPFGIPLVEADPRYTSRFEARSLRPGIRCREVAGIEEWETPFLTRELSKAFYGSLTVGSAEQEAINFLDTWRSALAAARRQNRPLTLLVPETGGPLFLPAVAAPGANLAPTVQADLNAAINIALRGIAPPDVWAAWPFVRLEPLAEGWSWPTGGMSSKRFKYLRQHYTLGARRPAADDKAGNWVADPHGLAPQTETVLAEGLRPVSFSAKKEFWTAVARLGLQRLIAVNRARLSDAHLGAPDPNDDLPM